MFAKAGEVSTKDKMKIHLGYASPQAVLVQYVGKSQGFFLRRGVDLELVSVRGAIITQALIGGSLEMGVSPTAPYLARLKGADLVFFACIGNVVKNDIVAGPGIQKVSQLKGKKFGLSTFGDRTDFLTRYMLKREGLEPSRDVAFVAVGEPSQRLIALQSKIIDATILSGGYLVQARQQGLKVLETPPIPFLREAQVTTQRFLKEKRPVVKAYLEGLIESIHFFLTQKEKTKGTIAQFLKTRDASVLEDSYNDVALTIDRKPYPTEEAIQNIFQMVAESEPKAKEKSPMEMWDLSLLKEIDQSGWIDGLYK